jgi:hypothetical protein
LLRDGRTSVMHYRPETHYDNQVAFLRDEMVWLESGELHARRALDDDIPATPERTLGEVKDAREAGEALRGCASGDSLHVVVRARGGDRLVSRVRGVWTALRKLSGTGGALACDGDRAWTARASLDDGGGALAIDACTPDGCTSSSVDAAAFFARDVEAARPGSGEDVEVTPFGGDLLVVWRSREGGLRMRLAPLDGIAESPDVVLFDDRAPAGVVDGSTPVGFRVHVRPGFATVLLATTAGVRAIAIAPSTSFARVAVARP